MNEEEKLNGAAENAAEEVKESAAETAEDAADTAAETVEDAAEAAKDAAAEAAETLENPVGYSTDEVNETPQAVKKSTVGIIAAVVVIVVAIAFAANMFFMGDKSKRGSSYDGDYLDIDGTTAASIADQQGMEYADFLEMYGLPADLPGETNGNATENLIPLGTYVKLMGSDMDTIREQMGWDESFTEETTLGEAKDRTPLSQLVGDESLDQFKEMYELDDAVNGDTLFNEVRHQVELKERQMYEEQKAAEEADTAEAADAAEADTEEEAATEQAEESEKSENSAEKE